MGFFDELKDFGSTLRRLARHWPFLIALILVLAFAGLYVQKRFFPPPAPVETTQAPTGEAGAPANKGAETATPQDKAEPEPGAEATAESLSGQMIDVVAHPVLVLKGQAKWDDAAKTISASLAKVSAAAAKAGLSPNGRPLAVFTETDDAGFHYEAMLPIANAPDGKTKLSESVEVGTSPAGKALKFEHRGAYDEIDATYEAITAYLDEKGLDTKNLFIEEYLNELSPAEDANVDVDIYVFVK